MAKPARTGGPRVVAELGRPETPEETAARKAESSRKHRANQTVKNLVLALAACLAVVLVLVLLVVRPDQPARDPVDYAAVAEEAQPAVEEPLAVPALPAEWTSNSAELTTETDDVTSWSVGLLTPGAQFIEMRQGIGAGDTWVANQLERSRESGAETVEGVRWSVYDNRDRGDTGNLAYAMSTTTDSGAYVLYGSADDTEFRLLAASLATEIRPDNPSGSAE